MLEKREYPRLGETVWSGTLENGLQLVVLPKMEYNKSMAFLAVNYGGSDRKFRTGTDWINTPAGVAHYLEHKMFDMENGDNALTVLSGRGASANAFTSSDMTAYHFESISKFYDNLDTLLAFVSVPYFTQESVDRERGIIAQEIRMVEDDPDYAVYYGLLNALFKANPVKDSVAGTVDSISEITPEVLYKCHSIFYIPENMILVVAGNQTPEKIADMAEAKFKKNYCMLPERDYGEERYLNPASSRNILNMEVGTPIFLAGAKSKTNLFGWDGAKFEIIADIALDTLFGTASPLYSKLYNAGLINETFTFDFEVTSRVSFISFGGESKDPESVIGQIINEARNLVSNGVPQDYFKRRKKSAIGSEIRSLNSFDNLCYNTAAAYFSGYNYFELLDIYNSITIEDVCNFLEDYFVPERIAVSLIQ